MHYGTHTVMSDRAPPFLVVLVRDGETGDEVDLDGTCDQYMAAGLAGIQGTRSPRNSTGAPA